MSVQNSIRWDRLLAAAGVACFAVVVTGVSTVEPAAGYEISIYWAYPWYFWAAVVCAIVSGQLVLIANANIDEPSWTEVIGVLTSASTVLTLSLLPYLRGYPIYGRGDVLTHLGFIRDLSQQGFTGNIYPPMHIVVQGLSGATGLPPNQLLTLLPFTFTIIFLGSMYWIVTALFPDWRRVLISLPFVLFPVLGSSHVMAIPYILSMLLTPFAVALLVVERGTSAVAFRAMLALAIAGVVLFHPLTGLFLVFVLAVYAVADWIGVPDTGSRLPTALTCFAFVVFAAWYLSFVSILIRFRTVTERFLAPGAGDSELVGTINTIERTGADLMDVIRIAVLKYGDAAILYAMATAGLGGYAVLWLRGRSRPSQLTAAFGATTLLFAGLSVIFLTNDLIVGFGRPLSFGKMFAAVLAGGLGYVAWKSADREATRWAVDVGLAATLLALVVISVASMYSSPLVADSGHQVSRMELDGMDWTLDHRNESIKIEEFGIQQYRHEHLRQGVDSSSSTIRREGTLPPDHFNYTRYGTLGRSYREDHYLVVTRLGRIVYPVNFPDYRDQWRFTAGDFRRLQYDQTVARVYDNGEFETYRIDASHPDQRPSG